MFGNIGVTELVLVLLIILVLFGARKIPQLARGLGQGIREFRKAAHDVQEGSGTEPGNPEDKNGPSDNSGAKP